jgi:thioesterase domain-containing protein
MVMVDTAGQTSRMTKKNTSNIQHEITNCPEDDATRRKKMVGKRSTGRVGDSRYVDTAKKRASVQHL